MNAKQLAFRQHTNLQILEVLRKIVMAHPELRFGQLLMVTKILMTKTEDNGKGDISTEILDPWNEEPEVTAKRMMSEILEGEAQL